MNIRRNLVVSVLMTIVTTLILGVIYPLVITAIAQAGSQLLSSAGVSSIYYELRSIREGVSPEALASVFD